MPTVAAWHAASWFENSFNPIESFPRVAKLQHMMGEAYRAKCAAIESDNVTHMIQAASYFTEVTGALGARLAIVKGHEKLPQALKTSCGSFLDIGFNDSLAGSRPSNNKQARGTTKARQFSAGSSRSGHQSLRHVAFPGHHGSRQLHGP